MATINRKEWLKRGRINGTELRKDRKKLSRAVRRICKPDGIEGDTVPN